MSRAPLLSVQNLSLAFGSHTALSGLSFDIARGETVALVGESGSGKSATALALMRLIEREGGRLTGGRIDLDGDTPVEITALEEREMQQVRGNRISMIFQEPMTALNPVMPLGEQVAEVLRLHQGLDRKASLAAARAAFERVNIPEPERRLVQYPHELSGGLRQRVMIAMALACQPDLLIADEPTTALDVTTQAEILSLIKELQEESGMAVLFITHDMGVVAEIADRVVVLCRGEQVETGPVGQIFAAPQAEYTRNLMAATPMLGAGAPKRPLSADAPLLEVDRLSVRFPVRRAAPGRPALDYHAVNEVSLTLGRGETLGLVGESGCGKSTLARTLLGLEAASGGRVRLSGQTLTGLTAQELRPLRGKMQMVFQDPYASLNPRLPVYDLITEPAHIRNPMTRAERRAMAGDLLERVGLEPAAMDRYPHQFSGGQRQRLCICRALSVKPAIIVADEAVSALDVSVARQITDLIAKLQREEGVSFLFISHDIAVVERVSHRIAVMWAGQVVETGPTDTVLKNPFHPYTRRLLSAVPHPDPQRRPLQRERASDLKTPKLLLPRATDPERIALREVGEGHFVAIRDTVELMAYQSMASAAPEAVREAEREGVGSMVF
ncbi:ABC transporter ATP-binding protein [Thioclava sp. F36-7]|uniref:ABC transporter ATP-binding protein n=1 Tax=Thioclava sp. F36-7 TaxID=1915317 RepID=UPI0009CDFEF0|nr:ABC transporter ATP-binding protein [Thioclava sp. F36-7]OOY10773.1 ABC transporter ATP-binding protein [Thioclava sp. F36-7]